MTILNPGRPRRLTAEFYDAFGRPARVDGSPVWAVSNPEAVEIIPTVSAFAVRIVRKEPPVYGPVEVTATADADLGDGVRPIVLRATFSIPEPEAASGALVVSDEEAPAEPEPEPTVDPEPDPVFGPAPAPEPVDVAPVVDEVKPLEPLPDPKPPIDDRPTE